MTKRIVFCADGTWQSPLNNTNVYRFYRGLLQTQDQLALYDDGVGADGAGIQRLIQGTTGQGLVQKTDGLVDQVFQAYRNPTQREELLKALREHLVCGAVEFIGVWNTVGALGVPAIFGGFDEKQYGFLDTTLHPDVRQAYHCMSIDERRRQFPATLWTEPAAPNQTLEQIYFTGCHGDIGGGTLFGAGVDDQTRLCDIPLSYMVAKGTAAGLKFDPQFLQQCAELPAEYALDKYRDSWSPEFQMPLSRNIAANAKIANSVSLRIQYALTYAPPNIIAPDLQLANTYDVVEVVTPA